MTSDKSKRLIIGLVGRKGSGKGAVAKQLKERYGASVYRFSDVLRDILDLLYLEKTRENLVQMSEVVRKGFGEDVIQNALIARAKKDGAPLIVLDGARRVDDLDHLEKLGLFYLINITAPLDVRYARLTRRGENAGEATRTLESFKKLEHAPTEVTIPDVEAKAWRTIDNSGSYDDLVKQVDDMMKELGYEG